MTTLGDAARRKTRANSAVITARAALAAAEEEYASASAEFARVSTEPAGKSVAEILAAPRTRHDVELSDEALAELDQL